MAMFSHVFVAGEIDFLISLEDFYLMIRLLLLMNSFHSASIDVDKGSGTFQGMAEAFCWTCSFREHPVNFIDCQVVDAFNSKILDQNNQMPTDG
jgi:hypothetical protein